MNTFDKFRLGQAVHVNAYATWWPATVTSVTRTRIGVDFPTDLPTRLTGPVPAWVVRPAAGIRLRRIATIQPGDEVVDFTGTGHRVLSLWQAADRWWVIDYADGGRATLGPNTVLRLSDPTTVAAVPQQPGTPA